jgi:hypothetical protein
VVPSIEGQEPRAFLAGLFNLMAVSTLYLNLVALRGVSVISYLG